MQIFRVTRLSRPGDHAGWHFKSIGLFNVRTFSTYESLILIPLVPPMYLIDLTGQVRMRFSELQVACPPNQPWQ